MSDATAGRWVRLQDAGHFVGNLWLGSDERQRREILVTALLSGNVPMRARFVAKPRREDGQPALPSLERKGSLGTTTPIPGVEAYLRMDPRLVTWDIPAGRVVISPIYDDKRFWGGFDWDSHFPGGTTVATGRFLTVELDDIEFDGTAARAYIVEDLLPGNATAADETAPNVESWSPASPPAGGNVVPFLPYNTGLPGKPSSWHLVEAECRRRYEAGERHPNDLTERESPAEWARVLIDWLANTHPQAPPLTRKALTNRLSSFLRELARIIHEALEALIARRDGRAVFRGVGDAAIGV
jgi:hypothetical protein